MKPTVLVTGATGFVGGRLVESLLQNGESVLCLVRSSSDTRALRKLPVRLVVADLENAEALNDTSEIRTVFHVAGAIKAASREDFFRTNQIGTRRLLETIAKKPGVRRFVHISSLAAAGPSPEGRALKEGENENPISWYGESKLASEKEVLGFSHRIPVTILRPSAVYGPGDRETLLIFKMIKRGCLFTPGRFTRRFSLIHVDDLTDAIIKAGNQDTASGEIFFITREEIYTWDEVGRAIAKELGKKYKRIAFPGGIARIAGIAGDLWSKLSGRPATVSSQKVKELLQPNWICSPAKARSGLQFNPRVVLEHGIHNTVAWYESQHWL